MNEAQVEKLKMEVNWLQQTPIFQEYMKLMNVLTEGDLIKQTIERKLKLINSLGSRQEPFSHLKQQEPEQEEEEEPVPVPPRKIATPAMKQSIKNRGMPSPRREQEINQKVAMAEAEDFSASPEEMGTVDDLELPDLELEEEK